MLSMHTSPLKCALAFGPFVLDADDLLSISNRRVHLFPKQLEALRYLASRSGRIVTKDELLSHVWRDAFVGEGSLHQCISAIRKQLGDAAGGLDAIETASKRGYRFTLPVTVVASPPKSKVADIAALRIGILQFDSKTVVGPSGFADRLTARVAALLSQLRIIGLEVINQAALDRMSTDPIEAAGQLRIGLLVTGHLFREDGARLGAEVEILRASDQTILSSGVVLPENPIHLDAKLAGCIARSLPLSKLGIDRDEIAMAMEAGQECLGLYLKGLASVRSMFSSSPFEHRRGEDLRLAIRYFTRSTEKDAGHLASLIGISNSVIIANSQGLLSADETVRLGLLASKAALAMEPQSPSARSAHAMFEWLFGDKQVSAQRELREVLDQYPDHFTATLFLAIGLMREGFLAEAIAILRDFLEHQPDIAIFCSWLTYGLFLERSFESALEEATNCAERFPDWDVAWAHLCFIAAHAGDDKVALEAGSRLSRITNNASLLAMEAYALAQSGEKQRAEELVEYIRVFHPEGTVQSSLVPALLALGKQYDALICLEHAHKERDVSVPLALIDARLDSIRVSPRFIRVREAYPRLNIQPNLGKRRPVQCAPIAEAWRRARESA